ncbi:solute carrier family 23 member 1-like [Mytilus trossulus]|uniref:solute carrier family 23 member 1-like n=1 Tax=Mytilus trossulus TaxID=6551 RepID=UPI003005CF34
MEVFGCGYARRPSIAEGKEAVRQRKFSVRSKGSTDENDENDDGYKGEINPVFMLRNGSISSTIPIELPSKRTSVSSSRASDAGLYLSKLKEVEEEKDPEKDVEIIDESWKLVYKVSDSPPILLTVFFAVQQILMSLPGCVITAVLVASSVCGKEDEVLKAKLLATTIFLSGLTTFLQVTFGVRLPVFQGPTPAYVIPILALASLPEWACPTNAVGNNSTERLFTMGNETFNIERLRSDYIYPRLQTLQGSLVFAGLFHCLIGLTGLVGLMVKFIGPITVIPTLLLIGIEFYSVVTNLCDAHWGISAITASVAIILAVYLAGWAMPLPVWTRSQGCHIIRFPLQQVLAILLSMMIGWSVSAIMTSTNSISDDPNSEQYKARADYGIRTINKTPWFYVPYPGQFGAIGFDGGVFVAFVTATLTSIIDSIADYYACAKMSHLPPPPLHAMNRGIAFEGFMSMIAGFFGAGHATTTYGGNIGTIGMTKVASRRVYQVFAIILIVFSVLGKFTAVFVTIPDPVIGGVSVVGFGTFLGLVLSNLQYIDLNSSRNLAVIGISLLIGLMVPHWVKQNPESLSTGTPDLDSLLRTILSNPMMGGFVAFFLDNTISGSKLERGLAEWDTSNQDVEEISDCDYEEDVTVYEILFISKLLKNVSWLKYIPILPNFDPNVYKCSCNCSCCGRCKKEKL